MFFYPRLRASRGQCEQGPPGLLGGWPGTVQGSLLQFPHPDSISTPSWPQSSSWSGLASLQMGEPIPANSFWDSCPSKQQQGVFIAHFFTETWGWGQPWRWHLESFHCPPGRVGKWCCYHPPPQRTWDWQWVRRNDLPPHPSRRR